MSWSARQLLIKRLSCPAGSNVPGASDSKFSGVGLNDNSKKNASSNTGASQKMQVIAAAQSSQSSHVEAMSLENDHESGATSSGPTDITWRIDLAISQWLLKGKRNSRTRRMFVSPGLHDVPVEVQASYRPERVPYISLTSKVNNRPIVGHPIAIQVLKDGSIDDILDSVSESHSSSSESEYEVPSFRRADMVYTRRPRGKPPTKNHSLQRYASMAKYKKTRKLSSLTTGSQGKNREEEHKPVVEKVKGPVVACVPLK